MRYFALFSISLLFTIQLSAQDQTKILGTWLTQDGDSKVEIIKNSSGKFEGSIIWLKEPNEENGTPKIDDENPDVKLQKRPIMGLKILDNLVFAADDKEWTDGTVYDPKSGNTYDCYIWFEDNDFTTLYVKGYIGVSIIGRKAIWTRAK
jgi:uncharacterized protein (DUF2147 family)